jgi:DNA-binding NtrC family response regulator
MATILLVEDEIYLAQVIVQELEKCGYDMLQARDGLTALQLHEKNKPDLIILVDDPRSRRVRSLAPAARGFANPCPHAYLSFGRS